ncbi:RNaseH domain-containing protein [Micromonospora sp. NPDC047134]|uniref:RNaseH domain-containing protein n=1 Tax=Micromonospora sp. NPDC047134 TaxID=3154340 RepID=UPI0033D40B09
MTTGDDKLHLLAYPITPELHGVAHLYRFPDHVADVWNELLDRYQEATGSRGNLPYAGLCTALRAIGRTSVNVHPTTRSDPPRFMVSRKQLHADDIRDAVTIWEQALLDTPEDQIGFSYTSELAELLAAVEPELVGLGDQLTWHGDQLDAPRWVWEAATWEIAERLSGDPWTIDSTDVILRHDTDGNVTVWDSDQLWTGHWEEQEDDLHYATLRMQLAMKTLPWMRHPVLVADPAVSWYSRWLSSARTGWLAQHSLDDPLLSLAFEGRGSGTRIERTSDLALTVWSRLRGEELIRPEDRDLTGVPGRLRTLVPKSVRFPIGRGVGMYTIRELSTRMATALKVENITASNIVGHRFPKAARRQLTLGRDSDLLHDDALPTIISASGCQRLRILVLYSEQHTRARLQRLLAYHLNRPDLAETGIPEDQAVAVGPNVEIVFCHAAQLLAHGEHTERAALLAKLPHLDAPAGTRLLALCETEYDARKWAAQRKAARKKDSKVEDPDLIDAKPVLSRLLAQHEILVQFIKTKQATSAPEPDPAETDQADPEPDEEDTEAPPEDDALTALGKTLRKDHAGHAAVADLLRAGGLVHPRLTQALAYGRFGITEPIAFVGLHVREQRGQKRFGPKRISWSLVAFIPDGQHWNVKAYQAKRHPRGGPSGWQDYFTANTAFRSHSLPEGSRQDLTLVDTIDTALGQLRAHLAAAVGYVLLVSGDSSRSLWPLLANKNLDLQPDAAGQVNGRPALPGYSRSCGHRPRAVVRVTSGSTDLPRPVEVHGVKTVKSKNGEKEQKPYLGKTTEALYQLDGARNTWILSNIPRQFKGGRRYSRAGESSSRWTADVEAGSHTWYAHTSTEIVVLGCDENPIRYAIAAARLCDHAVSWDGRTQYPAPVHLAIKMDKDHPDYRRTIDLEEERELDELNDGE